MTPFIFFLHSIFPTPPSQLRRASLVPSAQVSPRKAVFQFRLLLAHLTELLLPPDFSESSLSTFIFLAAGDLNGNVDSPWPASSGEPLPSIVGSLVSSRCCSAHSTLACSFCPLQSPELHRRRGTLRRDPGHRRNTSPELLRSRLLLQHDRGEPLMLPVLSVSLLPALFRRRNAVVPPRPPWPVSALFHAVINLQSAIDRCA